MQLRAIAITFPDIMRIGPSAMDIDTKVREQLDNFNILNGHRHKAQCSPEGRRHWFESWSLTSSLEGQPASEQFCPDVLPDTTSDLQRTSCDLFDTSYTVINCQIRNMVFQEQSEPLQYFGTTSPKPMCYQSFWQTKTATQLPANFAQLKVG